MEFSHSLADLDELVLACRHQRARSYLSEAIASYKAGAYRAAIVTTWIAVCFDFIEKMHELTLSGDKEASIITTALYEARAKNDLSWSLKFEKTLLACARDKFELISQLEFVDLDRLQEDRNRCAHPSLASDGEPFHPTAELARLHIRSAVTHILQHPPVQGKAALDRLIGEVKSPYFPTTPREAIIALSNGPLKRPRKSLVVNFIVILIKRLFSFECDFKERMGLSSALKATQSMQAITFEETLKSKLSSLIRNVSDKEIHLVVSTIVDLPSAWPYLDEDVQQKLKSYVQNLPDEELEILEAIERYEPLKREAEHKMAVASIAALRKATWFMPPLPVVRRYIEAYCVSKSYDQANTMGAELRGVTPLLTLEDIDTIVQAAASNDQITYSFSFSPLLIGIIKAKKISKDDLEGKLAAHGLERFIPINT